MILYKVRGKIMIRNEDFTRKYLDKIIFASERHTVDEWLGAFKKTFRNYERA